MADDTTPPDTTLPEVTVNAQAPVSDMDSSPYTQALGEVDPLLGKVEGAIRAEDEPRAQAWEAAAEQHRQVSEAWTRREADLAQQMADWTKQVGPEMASYIDKTPNRQGIYAANMHIAPMLAILSAIGGKMTRASGLQMLAATTGAVQGMNQGNEQAYQAAIDRWSTGLSKFQAQVKMQEQYYTLMLKAYGGRADAEEKAAAAAERMSGNIRSDEQKKLASAVQAYRAQQSAANQLAHLDLTRQGLDIQRQRLALEQARAGAGGAGGASAVTADGFNAYQVMGSISGAGISVPGGGRYGPGIVAGYISGHPEKTRDEIVSDFRTGKLEQIGAGSAIRAMETRTAPVTQAQVALIQPGGLYDRLQSSAAKLNFGDVQVQNQIRDWTSKHWSPNPDIQRYMTDLEDTRAELATVLSRGGRMSDQARGWAEEALPAVTSRRALNVAVEESRAIGQRVLEGDIRAIDMVTKGASLKEIFQSTTGTPAPHTPSAAAAAGGERATTPPAPAAAAPSGGTTGTDTTGRSFIRQPDGSLINPATGTRWVPDGRGGYTRANGNANAR